MKYDMLNGVTSIEYYSNGHIKSYTIDQPNEIDTSSGTIEIRTGLHLYPNGNLKSCEPNSNSYIDTPIGSIHAYDVNATHMSNEHYSLNYDENGNLISLVTSTDGIEITSIDGIEVAPIFFKPELIDSLMAPDETDLLPLKLKFEANHIIIVGITDKSYDLSKNAFTINPLIHRLPKDCSDCSKCKGCS